MAPRAAAGASAGASSKGPARFDIEGDHGERMTINYPAGAVPNLFGPRAFVVVEGEADGPGTLRASSVIIKHEDEFLTEDRGAPAAKR
jgi:cytochrome c-type biogenesis protein CcmE